MKIEVPYYESNGQYAFGNQMDRPKAGQVDIDLDEWKRYQSLKIAFSKAHERLVERVVYQGVTHESS